MTEKRDRRGGSGGDPGRPTGTRESDAAVGIIVREASWDADADACRRIRHDVFVVGQNVPVELEQDGRDGECLHALALEDGRPVGTARMFPDGHIGRVAVLDDRQGRGLGRRLMMVLEEAAARRGLEATWLNSQLSAAGFYERLGYRAEGSTFFEAGIEHVRMMRRLPPA